MLNISQKRVNGATRWIIGNGNLSQYRGHRAVVVDPNGIIRDVNHVHRKGDNTRQQTFQLGFDGDFVLVRAYGDQSITLKQLSVVSGGADDDVHHTVRSEIMRKVPLTLEEWLEDESGTPNTLPAGYGWDGERTGSEISKYMRVEKFLSKLPLRTRAEILRYVIESPSSQMPTSWRKHGVDGLPKELAFGYQWIVQHTDRSISVINPRGKCSPTPKTAERIIKICFNRPNYEVGWELFVTPRYDKVYKRLSM